MNQAMAVVHDQAMLGKGPGSDEFIVNTQLNREPLHKDRASRGQGTTISVNLAMPELAGLVKLPTQIIDKIWEDRNISSGDHVVSRVNKNEAMLDWENAQETPDIELIRRTGYLPISRSNYVLNQKSLRKAFLILFQEIQTDSGLTWEKFKEKFKNLNKILFKGESGKSYYFPDHIDDPTQLEEIAGSFRGYGDLDDIVKKLFLDLKEFLSPGFNQKKDLKDIAKYIFSIYYTMIHRLLFLRGNNSLAMNMVNLMVRLYGLNGISHDFLDISILKGVNKNEIQQEFLEKLEEANSDVDFNMKAIDFLKGDKAMRLNLNKGGIDFNSDKMNLQVKMDSRFRGNDSREGGNDNGIKFHIDPAMLQRLQNAPGFVPVIINIRPLNNLRQFLGIDATI